MEPSERRQRVQPERAVYFKYLVLLSGGGWCGGGDHRTFCGSVAIKVNLLQHFLYFQIIRERLPDYPTRNSFIWNTSPGALLTLPNFADSSRFVGFLFTFKHME